MSSKSKHEQHRDPVVDPTPREVEDDEEEEEEEEDDDNVTTTGVSLAIDDNDLLTARQDGHSSRTKIGGHATFCEQAHKAKIVEKLQNDINRATTCDVCGREMFLLAQSYCPINDTHNRMLYVWCCNDPQCAVVAQEDLETAQDEDEEESPVASPASSSAPETESESSPTSASSPKAAQKDDDKKTSLRPVVRKAFKCFMVQCDSEDPTIDDPSDDDGDEKRPASPTTKPKLPAYQFKPRGLFVDDEPVKETIHQTALEKELEAKATGGGAGSDSEGEAVRKAKADKNKKQVLDDETRQLQELEQQVDLKNNASDRYFEVFRSRIAREPQQVLRYAFNLPTPLFMNPAVVRRQLELLRQRQQQYSSPASSPSSPASPSSPIPQKCLPTCPHCNTPLASEMQVMPTALYLLHVASATMPAARPDKALGACTPSPTSVDKPQEGTGKSKKNADRSSACSTPSATSTSAMTGGVDFATVTIFTCPKGCQMNRSGVYFQEEFVLVEPPPVEETAAAEAGVSSGTKKKKKLTLKDLVSGKGFSAEEN